MAVTKPKPSSQQQVPGTESGSAELRKKHEQYAIAKYERKVAGERMRELKVEIIDHMRDEGLPAITSEIEVGDDYRVCRTELVEDVKLKSKLDEPEE